MITSGPDEALWFTLNRAGAIGRIDLDGKVTLHRLPTADAAPVGITYGPDEAVWFAGIAARQIGRLGMDGTFQEFPLPDRGAKPHAIAMAPSGECWSPDGAAPLAARRHRPRTGDAARALHPRRRHSPSMTRACASAKVCRNAFNGAYSSEW